MATEIAILVADRVQAQTLITHSGKLFGTIPAKLSVSGKPETFLIPSGETACFAQTAGRWNVKLQTDEILGGIYLTKITDSKTENNPLERLPEEDDEDDDDESGIEVRQIHFGGISSIGLKYNLSLGVKNTPATAYEVQNYAALFAEKNLWMGLEIVSGGPNVVNPLQHSLDSLVPNISHPTVSPPTAVNLDDDEDDDDISDDDADHVIASAKKLSKKTTKAK